MATAMKVLGGCGFSYLSKFTFRHQSLAVVTRLAIGADSGQGLLPDFWPFVLMRAMAEHF